MTNKDTLGDLAYRGEVDALTSRLDGGENPNDPEQSFSGAMPLFCAARYGHPACVAVLLARSADIALQHPEAGTALQGAASSGHTEIVQMLLAARASPNTLDKGGDSALTGAAYAGHAGVVRVLLEAGADKALRHPEYGTALEMAVAEGHLEAAAILRGGEALPESTIPPDSSVTVSGLVASAQHNGKTGVVRSFCLSSGRYIVRLPGEGGTEGETIKIRPGNVSRC